MKERRGDACPGGARWQTSGLNGWNARGARLWDGMVRARMGLLMEAISESDMLTVATFRGPLDICRRPFTSSVMKYRIPHFENVDE